MIALYSDEITEMCRKMNLPLIGVFNKNKLPHQQMTGLYVVNLEDDRDKFGYKLAGSHWVCFGILPNKHFYFDSMGVDLMPIEVSNFLNNFNIYCNDVQVQAIGTEYCGYFCLGVMAHIYNNHGTGKVLMHQFTDMFYNDLKSIHNYDILKKYIKNNIMHD